MPSTFSTSLRLELQADGENSGTWGSKTNNNLNLLEQAISGRTAVVLASTATTLTATNGVSDQARAAILDLSGTLTANSTVTVPTATKWFIVYNNTAGSYTLTVQTAAGTGVACPQGYKTLVYCDGTNVVSGLNSLVSGILSGTTTLPNAGQIDSSGQLGLGTTPAQLLHARKDQNTATIVMAQNATVGAAASVAHRAQADVAICDVGATSSSYTPDGNLGASAGFLQSSAAGGIVLRAYNASGAISLAAGGTTEVINVASATTTVKNKAVFNKQTSGTISSNTSATGTVTLDLSTSNNFALTAIGNISIANPSNPVAGQSGIIVITQDPTGSRTLAWGSFFKWPSGITATASTAANSIDVYSYYCVSTTQIAIAQTRGIA